VCPSSLLTSPAGFSFAPHIRLHVATVWKTGRICFCDDKPRARAFEQEAEGHFDSRAAGK
ncbi:hypothetical protein M9458_008858, partial [Cirrhinus mrigala]